jgi:hypothetical protein
VRRATVVAHSGAEERLIFEGALELMLPLAKHVR